LAEIENIFFKYRSYTPVPFLLVMVFFAQPTIASLITGFCIMVFGELIRFWGVSWAGSETRTTGGAGGTFLIISGPFGYVRNPLYVGNILMYVGIGIMSMSLFPYLQIITFIFFAVQYYFIVLGEEKFLQKKFSKEFCEYCENVPRFLPKIVAFKNKNIEQPPLNYKAGFRSERRTLQALTLVSLIILVIWIFKNQ
jgi:protein-S-isoprenylcysteine O-methyltransferase Ste14